MEKISSTMVAKILNSFFVKNPKKWKRDIENDVPFIITNIAEIGSVIYFETFLRCLAGQLSLL